MSEKKTSSRLTGAAGVVTAIGMLALLIVGNYEGIRLKAYKDVIGIWTICQGLTRVDGKPVRSGMIFSKEKCDILFIEELAEHEAGMRKCLKDPDAIPDKVYVSFLSLTYNIGVGGFCRSSVRSAWNAGLPVTACENLLKFNRAGGRVVAGLVKRRSSELKLCLEGLQ